MYVWLQKSTAALNDVGILESPFEELILCIASILKDHGLSQAYFVRALLFNADKWQQ